MRGGQEELAVLLEGAGGLQGGVLGNLKQGSEAAGRE